MEGARRAAGRAGFMQVAIEAGGREGGGGGAMPTGVRGKRGRYAMFVSPAGVRGRGRRYARFASPGKGGGVGWNEGQG